MNKKDKEELFEFALDFTKKCIDGDQDFANFTREEQSNILGMCAGCVASVVHFLGIQPRKKVLKCKKNDVAKA